MRLLIINPNTSTHMTDALKPLISQLDLPNVSFTYLTSPSGPSVIASIEDLHSSTIHTLPAVIELHERDPFDGYLIAGYADHPLTACVQAAVAPAPAVGIFEASVNAAAGIVRHRPNSKFGIITTGFAYETLLSQGVVRLSEADPSGESAAEMLGGVVATGISPHILETESADGIQERFDAAVKRLAAAGPVDAVCIGGVLLANSAPYVRAACVAEFGSARGKEIVIVDQMAAGIEALVGYVQAAH